MKSPLRWSDGFAEGNKTSPVDGRTDDGKGIWTSPLSVSAGSGGGTRSSSFGWNAGIGEASSFGRCANGGEGIWTFLLGACAGVGEGTLDSITGVGEGIKTFSSDGSLVALVSVFIPALIVAQQTSLQWFLCCSLHAPGLLAH